MDLGWNDLITLEDKDNGKEKDKDKKSAEKAHHVLFLFEKVGIQAYVLEVFFVIFQ